MGVMSCSRGGCSNIMCDTHVNGVGYVCTECQQEFKNFLNNTNLRPKTTNQVVSVLRRFMETDKGNFEVTQSIDIDKFFQENTR